MFDRLQALDEAIFRAVNQGCAHPAWDWLFAGISSERLFAPVIGVGVVAFLLFGGARGRLLVAVAALNLAIGDGLVNRGIRAVVQRPRPHEALVGTRKIGWRDGGPQVGTIQSVYDKPGGKSFPSGHMINNASTGAAVAWLYPATAVPVIGWLALMGVARVYCGAHYPSDVVGSIWLGLASAAFNIALLEVAWRLARSRWRRLANAPPSLLGLATTRRKA